MSHTLVLSAALVVVAMSSSANAGVATVTSEGLFKGEELVNFAKSLLGDALDFVGDTATNALAKTKSVITKLGDNDKFLDFMGSHGWEFDASDLIDKNLMEHLKDADSFDAAFAALEEVRVGPRFVPEPLKSDRSIVLAFAVFHGTQTGEGGPVAPTGNVVASDYVYAMEFAGGKVSHMTKIWNDGHALSQLGWA